MRMCIKDYFDGVEKILSRYQKKVQEVLTGYLKRRNTNRNWDEIIVDDFNILKHSFKKCNCCSWYFASGKLSL